MLYGGRYRDRTSRQALCFVNPEAASWCSGIIWPVECIPYPLRYISLALPQTYASEALRCIMYRGEAPLHNAHCFHRSAVCSVLCMWWRYAHQRTHTHTHTHTHLISQSYKSLIISGSVVTQSGGMWGILVSLFAPVLLCFVAFSLLRSLYLRYMLGPCVGSQRSCFLYADLIVEVH